MKRTRIRPAFVVTLVALSPVACQKQTPRGNPPPPTATVPVGTAPTTTTGVSANPPPVLAQRKVRDPVPPQYERYSGHIDYGKAQRLNPHGPENRTILTNEKGGCYVLVQADPNAPIGPPGTGLRADPVDCPASMLDPAWDTCLHGDLVRTASGDCVCDRMGNPPPPPSKAECPE